jgi:hypothetical protein
VEADPMADGSFAEHLILDATGRSGEMHLCE